MRVLSRFSCILCVCGASFGQSGEPAPAFEMADVHVSAPSRNAFRRGPSGRGVRYELLNATMVDMISVASGIDADKILGGPSWLEWDRFDVIAKAPPDATPAARKAMLQTLLADRFKLKMHNDTQPMPAYALTVGKHPQLKPSTGAGRTGCKWSNQPTPNADGSIMLSSMNVEYTCENMTMAAFAEGVRGMIFAAPSLNGNPVVDQTGLKGGWDFNVKYSIRMAGRGGDSDTLTFSEAVEKQLGLKLDPVKVPLPVIVVDGVNHTPTDNLPGVKESLQRAAAPKEFEVAVIKPSVDDSPRMGMRIQAGGRVNISNMPLRSIIQQAFSVTNDTLVGTQKWLDTDRYDIVAKAPTTGAATPDQIDTDDVWAMMRALLADRFKLVTHTEERPLPAYTLLALKPKMKKADPSSRTRYREGPPADAKDPREKNPALSRLVTCQNMTMAQFADKLQNIAGGYIHGAVLDSTGLEGGWDFTLSFSPIGMVNGGGGGRGGRGGEAAAASPAEGPGGTASDPTGALSLFDAVEKQLGLKLELQKRPTTVLVIDRLEQKPTEN